MSEPDPAALFQALRGQMGGWAFQSRCPECYALIAGARYYQGTRVWLLGKTERITPGDARTFHKIPARAYLKKPIGEPIGCAKHRATWADFTDERVKE